MSASFDPGADLIVVMTRIWGPEGDAWASLALDTGASMTVIAPMTLAAVGLAPGSGSPRIGVVTGSGREQLPQVVLHRIRALSVEHSSFPVLSHTLPPTAGVDGVLGLDFLRAQRLTIDFQEGSITLE